MRMRRRAEARPQEQAQGMSAAATQAASQSMKQHSGSMKQTNSAQGLQSGSSASPSTHGSWLQVPMVSQSAGQVDAFSSASHVELGQTEQVVQSEAHEVQLSPGSQTVLPQQVPQSAGHVEHVSGVSHVVSPH